MSNVCKQTVNIYGYYMGEDSHLRHICALSYGFPHPGCDTPELRRNCLAHHCVSDPFLVFAYEVKSIKEGRYEPVQAD